MKQITSIWLNYRNSFFSSPIHICDTKYIIHAGHVDIIFVIYVMIDFQSISTLSVEVIWKSIVICPLCYLNPTLWSFIIWFELLFERIKLNLRNFLCFNFHIALVLWVFFVCPHRHGNDFYNFPAGFASIGGNSVF